MTIDELIESIKKSDNAAYYKFEYSREYTGGNFGGVGRDAYIPAPLVIRVGINSAFKEWLGIDPVHIIYYSKDKAFDSGGNWDDREVGEDGFFVEDQDD